MDGGDTDKNQRMVVVDVDTGVDDALALLLLLAADAVNEIKLLAVTCVGGNTGLANVCRNTLRLLSAANRLDIPVFAGAEKPLISERSAKTTYHGLDGFGDLNEKDFPVPDIKNLLQKESAVAALNRIVSENEGKVSLVCLAPLTNIALAMRTYPAFGRGLRDVHIMGGNVRGSGNTTPCAEFNFSADPEAAHIVLETAACPVQVTPWESCADHPLEMDWRRNTLPAAGGGAALALVTAAEIAVSGKGKHPTTWVCCDELAVASLLRPGLVVRDRLRHVSVELSGSRTRGQMVPTCVYRTCSCPEDCSGPEPGSGRPARILEAFDVDGLKQLLLWSATRWTKR